MKTITKALRTFWDVSVGSCIGGLSVIGTLFVLFMFVIADAKSRRALFEMWENVYGNEDDDDYTYTRKKKESE